MTISVLIRQAALRVLLPLASLFLAACHNPPPPAISVTSPPPPRFGSAPLAAYDEYAMALKPQVGVPRYERSILITAK